MVVIRAPIPLLCVLSLAAGCSSIGTGDAADAVTSEPGVALTAVVPTSTVPTGTVPDRQTTADVVRTAPSGPAPTAVPPRSTTTVAEVARTVVRYGPATSQFGELWLPPTPGPRPVTILVHGGFWRDTFGLDLMDDLAADLAAAGYAVWNIEYRRTGEDGGGWPGTFTDVAAAVDHVAALAADHPLDVGRVAVVGHSAGAHLALWAAGRSALPAGEPGAEPLVSPRAAVGLAPVVDLVGAAEDGIGLAAVDLLLGGPPAEVPERYRSATPRFGAEVRTVIVRGDADTAVPNRYSLPASGTVPDGVELVDVAGADHFDLIDTDHAAWSVVTDVLRATTGD